MSNIDLTVHTVIDRPRQEVADYACDPANDTDWIKNIKEVHWLTPPPVQVGTRVSRVAFFLKKRLAYTYRVEALEPGQRLSMRAEDGPFPMSTEYRFEDAHDGGTRMSINVAGQPGGFFGLAAPLLRAQMRRALTKDLALIKERLESR